MLGLLIGAAVVVFTTFYFLRKRKVRLNYSDNAVVITGCDSGFGLMTSLYLTEKGFKVIAACLTKEGQLFLQGKVALSVLCDVTKEEDLVNMTNLTEQYIKSNNLRLWGLVNNAGIAIFAYLDWASIKSFRKVFEVNYFAVVALIKLMLPLLKQTRNSRIINVCSVAGLTGYPEFSSYSGDLKSMI